MVQQKTILDLKRELENLLINMKASEGKPFSEQEKVYQEIASVHVQLLEMYERSLNMSRHMSLTIRKL